VVIVVPKEKGFKNLTKSLNKALRRKSSEEEALLYILAFLNSEAFNSLLNEKISKKRGGYPIVDERLLQKFGIPLPTETTKAIVEKLLEAARKAISQGSSEGIEKIINELVRELYKAVEGGTKPKAFLRSFVQVLEP